MKHSLVHWNTGNTEMIPLPYPVKNTAFKELFFFLKSETGLHTWPWMIWNVCGCVRLSSSSSQSRLLVSAVVSEVLTVWPRTDWEVGTCLLQTPKALQCLLCKMFQERVILIGALTERLLKFINSHWGFKTALQLFSCCKGRCLQSWRTSHLAFHAIQYENYDLRPAI